MALSANSREFRVAFWNCRMGLDRKRDALRELDADVLVVAEASAAFRPDPGIAAVFKGDFISKGLAVYVREPYAMSISPADPGLPWAVAVDVWLGRSRVLTCLAIWTVAMRGRPSYTSQAHLLIDRWEQSCAELNRDPWTNLILAGDFNASFQGPSVAKHAETVQRLEAVGMTSVHHHLTGEEHGAESTFSLRWIGRGSVPSYFHCDYMWISGDLGPRLANGGVGSMADWVESGLSDHAPVQLELDGRDALRDLGNAGSPPSIRSQ